MNIGKILRMGIAFLTILVMTNIFGGQVAMAAVSPGSGATKLALTYRVMNQSQNTNISISARLTENDKALGNEPVEFGIAANFFGARQVNLGTVNTDATGTAILVYQPSWEGTQVITAHFKGDGPYTQADVTSAITFAGPVQQYEPEQLGLAPVRQWITPAIGLGIVIFWILLLFVGVRTLSGIYGSRNQKLLRPQSIPFRGGNLSENIYQHRSSGNKI